MAHMPKHLSNDSLHKAADNSPGGHVLADNYTEPGCFNIKVFAEQDNKISTLPLC